MQDRKGNKDLSFVNDSRKINYNFYFFFNKPLICSDGKCLSVPGIWDWATKQTLRSYEYN